MVINKLRNPFPFGFTYSLKFNKNAFQYDACRPLVVHISQHALLPEAPGPRGCLLWGMVPGLGGGIPACTKADPPEQNHRHV